MKIIENRFEDILISEDLSIALGTFDGVHRGHQEIIKTAIEEAKARGIKSAVFTFDKHPFQVLKPDSQIQLITDNSAKAELIEQLGADYLFFVDFNTNFAGIEPLDFLKLLKQRLNSKVLVCGFNYTFGRFGKGNLDLLRNCEDTLGYDLRVIDRISYQGKDLSSSIIRKHIENGEIEEANELLGYNFFYKGEVVKGRQLGRELGFPTANLRIPDSIIIKNGIYITLTYIDDKAYSSVSNIGYNPTFELSNRLLESHVLDYRGDLYNKTVRVEFLKFIRGEMKFSSVDELKNQVFSDIETAREYFNYNTVYNV